MDPNMLKIKVSIGNRTYPLTIKRADEESVRKAAKTIESMLKDFQRNYAVQDQQDLLAMCALQLATKVERTQSDAVVVDQEVTDRLEALGKQLSDALAD
ncbi:cell division protein ZapA [Cryomorphaceae bacterium]|nr:cell division protein ZapA [Cryomorphaceae bacterium]